MSALPVAILAGGRATRLGPLAASSPKSLLHVAGRPFIFWQLELLARAGLTEAVLCIGHLGEQIRAAVGDGSRFGLTVHYSLDGERPLGTGGALRRALPLLGEQFFVLYGDSYLQCSFADARIAYEGSGAPALMTVVRNDNRWDRSNVDYHDGRIVEYNKRLPRTGMHYVDYGLSILCSAVVANYPAGVAFDLADLLSELASRGLLAGYLVSERFYEIGSFCGMRAAERFLAMRGRA